MALSAWQLYLWRPLCRAWPLEAKVLNRILELGCGRQPRGCRAGIRSRERRARIVNINNVQRSAVCSSPPVLIGNRLSVKSVASQLTVRDRCLMSGHCIPSSLPSPARTTALRCAVWNVRSLSKNTPAAVCERICATSRDVFVAVETWHDDALSPALALACPPGYCVVEKARPRSARHNDTTISNHGGIAVFHKSSMTVSQVALPDVSTFECLAIRPFPALATR